MSAAATPGALARASRAPPVAGAATDPAAVADPAAAATAPPRAPGLLRRRGYDGVAVAVPVTVPYVRHSPHGAMRFIGQALRRLLDASGLSAGDIDGLIVSSFSLAPDTAVGVVQALGLSPRWLDHLPTGGASGVMALRRAARAVQAGDAEVVACVAGDTNHVDSFRRLLGGFSGAARDATHPYGAGGPNAVFAMITAHYMRRFGATREDFGRIAVAQRANASRHPLALLRRPISLDEYLAAKPIAEPLHLLDCVMPCAGADAFAVMTEARARDLGLAHVRLAAAVERHNAYADDAIFERGGWRLERDGLWAMAGCAPGDVDVVQTYDDYPVIVAMQFEDLGFCADGEGPAFLRARTLTHDGDFPSNTGGGQLSMGQAGAAGGYVGVVEALHQLLGSAGERQVPNARRALVSGFGMVVYDRCICTGAVVLEATGGALRAAGEAALDGIGAGAGSTA